MKKKRLIIITSVVAGVIVLLGLVGGSVLAATSTAPTNAPKNPDSVFAAKVAAILGIDQAKVESAFMQAREQMRTEALDNQLKAMVAEGKMTQAQADQYKKWLQSKPDVPMMGGPWGSPGPMMGGPRGGPGPMMGPGGPPPGGPGERGPRPVPPSTSQSK